MTVTMAPSKHKQFGGSSAHRWLRCAGSVQLCATLPPQVENKYMTAGTHAHMLLEHMLVNHDNLAVLDYDFVGYSFDRCYLPFTKEDVAAVRLAFDFVQCLRSDTAQVHTEKAVELSDVVGGTVDVIVYDTATEVLHIVDYKHGVGEVDVKDNEQLKLYAACALSLFPPAKEIVTTIIQPNSVLSDPIKSAGYSLAEIMVFTDEVEDAVAGARFARDKIIFTPGEKQCKNCQAKHTCPALAEKGLDIFSPYQELKPDVLEGATLITVPSAEMCKHPEGMALMLKGAAMLRLWLSAIEEAAYAMATGGETLPGFKLVQKRASRRWQDEAAALETLLHEVDVEQIAPRKILSVAQAEKLMKAKSGAEGVRILADLVVKESSGLNLVPEEAAGEPVNPLQLTAAGFSSAVTIEG